MPSCRLFLLASIILLPPCWRECNGADKPTDAPKPDETKQIDRLIRQLGSEEFAQRESATNSLVRLGGAALEALRRAASVEWDAEIRRRAAELVEQIENTLDQLLVDYRKYGLPLPPDKAPLVRIEYGKGYAIGKDEEGEITLTKNPSDYRLGFLIEPASKDTEGTILEGIETNRRSKDYISPEIDLAQQTATDIETDLREPAQALALALQMHARGWKTAEMVFEKGFYGKSNDSPRTVLRFLVWKYWYHQLLDQEADRRPALRYMKALLTDEPTFDTPKHRHLLKSLELALVPSKARPGSVEALIDDLINAWTPDASHDERFARVLDLGFEAVPALLAHLDDDRLTRHGEWEQYQKHHEPAYHYRVCDMAGELLRLVAGEGAPTDWPIKSRDDRGAVNRLATAWWNQAKKQGEEAYLLAHVLPPLHKENRNDSVNPNEAHLRLVAKKYPKQLALLYQDILENRPDVSTYSLAYALGHCSLPREEKVNLFVRAVENKCLSTRYEAFEQLHNLDADRFVLLLVKALDDLPRTPESGGAYHAELVCDTKDPRAWRALERAAQRAEPILRMELLDRMVIKRWPPTQRRQRLAFLAVFLDDQAVRDLTAKDKSEINSYAETRFPELEVRNLAAMRIARILETSDNPRPKWTAEQWANLRDSMRAAVKRELTEKDKK